jgi:hypothetical protein
LSCSIGQAFERDLLRGRPLRHEDIALPGAARELLTALSYPYGGGFPADDVWPAVATA